MKIRFLPCVLILSISIAAFYVGGALSARSVRADIYSMIAIDAEEQLALYLEVLNELENGDPKKVRWMLQTSTAGRLDSILDFADFEDESHAKFRCKLLRRYKKYYESNQLFSTKEWEQIMTVDGVRESEQRRKSFFEKKLPIICPDD